MIFKIFNKLTGNMLASGYITGPNDHIRITKQAVLVEKNEKFYLSFFDMSLIDLEHMLEMRFNLYITPPINRANFIN